MADIHWLPPDRYAKLKGQTQLQMAKILEPFNMYGQDIYIKGAIESIMMVVEETWDVIRGQDKPIDIETVRRKRRK